MRSGKVFSVDLDPHLDGSLVIVDIEWAVPTVMGLAGGERLVEGNTYVPHFYSCPLRVSGEYVE